MGESFVRDGTMFPCLMVIDAAVYFRDVFICHSQLTEPSQCCNHKKLNKETSSSSSSCLNPNFFSPVFSSHRPNTAQHIMQHSSGSSNLKPGRSTVYFSKDQRKRFDLCVLAETKSCAPPLSLTLSLISSFPPPPFPLHLSISFLLVSFVPFLSPGVRPQRKFIGGGGMPVEVKRVSGSPSASPIILYS